MSVPVRFKLAWQNYRVGDVIVPPAMLRGWLLARGYCEALTQPEPQPAAAPPAPPRKRRRKP